MPGQLLPLRLLTNSLSPTGFSTMKLTKSLQSTSSASALSRMFPFRLKYLGLSRNLEVPVQPFGARKFSTGSFRPRDSGRSSSAVPRREFQGGGRGGRGGGGAGAASKSLIEDEDELSDWISGLKSDSLRVGLGSESDGGDDFGRGRNRGSRGDRDSVPSFRDQRGGRDSGPSFRGQRGGRDSGPSFRGGRGGRGSFRSDSDDNDDFGRGRGRGDRGSRGGRGSVSSFRSQRGGRDDFSSKRPRDDYGSFGKSSRGGRDDFSGSKRPREDFNGGVSRSDNGNFGRNYRGGRNEFSSSKSRFSSESEEDRDLDSYPRRTGGLGAGGGVSSPARRGGRDYEPSFGRSQGGGTLLKGRKQPTLISDEEDEDDDDSLSDEDDDDSVSEEEDVNVSVSGFGDLLSDEDNEEDSASDDDKDVDLFSGSTKEDTARPTPKASSGDTDSYLSGTRFDQCSVSPLSLKGIRDAGYERMTVVQEATLPVILKGKDVLAKAKTGTGKTVAFLLPSIEVIVKSPPVDRDQKRPPVFVLVICPTRELASQAAAEATTLLKYHPKIGVQVVIGGVRLALEQKRMQANPCQILVATPGRLRDHIENTAGFATRLTGVKVLVLDEADHLLDMGFRKDIDKIIAAVPKQRQTLLFSATVPPEVRQICHVALKRDHEFINTVLEGSEETHAQVRQTYLVAPLDKHFPLLYVLLKEHISDDVDYKVLVFCTTAMVTRLVASLLAELNMNVREIHSRKPQSYRTRVSDEFRKSKGLILVTSDVSARGVDYPDVTLVIQVGLPSDREQYIHRLGRTGRKGKEGQGVLLLAPWEEFFLRNLKDLPVTKASEPSVDPDTRKKVERGLSQVDMKNKEAAYQAWLGFYNSNKTVARDKLRLVELANEFSRSMGLDNPPAIPKLVLGKMGLKNVPGLRSK